MSTGDDTTPSDAELAEEYIRRSRRCTTHLETQQLTNWYAQRREAVDRGLAARRGVVVPIKPRTPEREEYLRRKASNPVSAAMFLQRVGRAAIFPDDDGSDGGGKAA